jgi:RNA polymerase sigma-70 factor (ECF subfamily)
MSESRPPAFEDMLASARQGSPAALGWLYRRFQPGLLRLLDVIAPDKAEDLASEVWLDVTVALPRFSGDERAFRAWLAHTARSRVIAGHRQADRRPAPSDAEAEELAAFAARVVSVLPAEQADVVLLRVVGGFDVAEVARLLGRQPATVRSLQHRALRRLARQTDTEVRSAS